MQSYVNFLENHKITLDPQQLWVLKKLAELDQQLNKSSGKRFLTKKHKSKGIYIWGQVGRGKTFLMDLFFNLLKTKRKTRLHFQRFMKSIHLQLFELAGKKDPLNFIAQQLADEVDIICLDELYIDDIANAMLIGGLFKALYKKGIIIVTTSNLHPNDLYENGINRQSFLPAIEQINHYFHIICLDGEMDYRCLSKTSGQVFFFGSNNLTQPKLLAYYQNITNEAHQEPKRMIINHREFNLTTRHNGIAWFSFHELCEKPRSQNDYIYIAENFHTLFISDISQLDDGSNASEFNSDRTRRFISLIDELYDQSVRLVASFEKELQQIYLGKKLQFLFNRTYSRLIEMQTQEYLERCLEKKINHFSDVGEMITC